MQPTEAEMTTWQKINPIVSQMCNVLEELSSYKGAVNEIREVKLICTFYFNTL